MDDDPNPDSTDPASERVLIANPEAGSADHVERVRALADERGFSVRETTASGRPTIRRRTGSDARWVRTRSISPRALLGGRFELL